MKLNFTYYENTVGITLEEFPWSNATIEDIMELSKKLEEIVLALKNKEVCFLPQE